MTTGKEKCVIAAQSYLAAFALSNIGQLSTTSIITLVLFFVCFQFFLFATVREKEALIQKDGKRLVRSLPAQKRFRSAFLLGLLFTCFYLAAEHQNLTGSLENPLFRAFYLLMTAAGLLVLFFSLPEISAACPGRPFPTHSRAEKAFSGRLPPSSSGKNPHSRHFAVLLASLVSLQFPRRDDARQPEPIPSGHGANRIQRSSSFPSHADPAAFSARRHGCF